MHEEQFKQLKVDFNSRNLAHAYLFVGQEGIRKFQLAADFAKFIQPDAIKDLDIVEIIDDGSAIKVDMIRTVIKGVNLTPQAAYKFLLIQNIERMTVAAANSFLKTLEEPPSQTIFILTTANLSLVLPTIISRTRVLRFSSTQKPEYSQFDMEAVDILLQRPDLVGRFEYVDEMLKEDSGHIIKFLDILLILFRKRLINGTDNSLKNIKALSKIDEAGILLKQNVNSRLVLENLMLSL